ncbi:MAG: SxtJ family membrane protein [Acidobacteriota bacterium]|nr:SxtJ family membrane protein [Acidobacteriota bacterium]
MTERADKSKTRAADNRQARKTALLVGSVLLVIAAWNYHRGRMGVVEVFGATGALLLVAGLFVPPAARAFHAGWMKFAYALGWINSRVLLTALFYGVFAPYGFVSRLTGRDPLRRRERDGETFWTTRKATRQTREQFERLF